MDCVHAEQTYLFKHRGNKRMHFPRWCKIWNQDSPCRMGQQGPELNLSLLPTTFISISVTMNCTKEVLKEHGKNNLLKQLKWIWGEGGASGFSIIMAVGITLKYHCVFMWYHKNNYWMSFLTLDHGTILKPAMSKSHITTVWSNLWMVNYSWSMSSIIISKTICIVPSRKAKVHDVCSISTTGSHNTIKVTHLQPYICQSTNMF